MTNILFIGGGRIGHAVRALLCPGLEISVFDRNDSKCEMTLSKEEAFSGADIIFVCVPTRGLSAAVEDIRNFAKDAKVVVLTKGMMDGDVFMHEYLSQNLTQDFYLLYGPMLAREICEAKFTGATLAGPAAGRSDVVSIFDKEKVFIEESDDRVGASILGVLKNVYTIMLSAIECFGFGDNYYGAVFSKIFREAGDVVVHFGGNRATVEGFSGLGDLVATSRSSFSSNKTFAIEMVKYGKCEVPAEGFRALPLLLRRLGSFEKELPVLLTVDKVCVNRGDLALFIKDLISDNCRSAVVMNR